MQLILVCIQTWPVSVHFLPIVVTFLSSSSEFLRALLYNGHVQEATHPIPCEGKRKQGHLYQQERFIHSTPFHSPVKCHRVSWKSCTWRPSPLQAKGKKKRSSWRRKRGNSTCRVSFTSLQMLLQIVLSDGEREVCHEHLVFPLVSILLPRHSFVRRPRTAGEVGLVSVLASPRVSPVNRVALGVARSQGHRIIDTERELLLYLSRVALLLEPGHAVPAQRIR